MRRPGRGAIQHRLLLPGLAVVVIAEIALSLFIGLYPVSPGAVIRALINLVAATPDISRSHQRETEFIVVNIIRLPRILLATLAGMGLGLSGAALQGLMRNPLVGPDIVGIAAGAALGAVGAIILSLPSSAVIALALGGGMLALAAASALAALARQAGVLGIVLAGVVVSAFFSALVSLAQYSASPATQLPGLVYWLMGSFAGATPDKVLIIACPVLGAGTLLVLLGWRINLLSLGDIDARALGIPVQRLRWTIIALVSLIVAAQVSVSGIVGWVGLVVPHLARMAAGSDHRRLLPASACLGGCFALSADDLARSVTSQELPIGLLTALVGTPVFALLFWRTQGRGWRRD